VTDDQRPHLDSFLMRESLLDKNVQASTEVPVFRMLPHSYVLKIGGRSVFDRGREVVYPVVDELSTALDSGHKLIIGTGGGARTRHVFSIGIDLGLPTGVLAQLAAADALGTAHMLGTLDTISRCSSTPHPASSTTDCHRTPSGSIHPGSAGSLLTVRMPAASCSPSASAARS
jgi:hypothetical protein